MYDYNVNLFGKMSVSVVAESKEDADRILNDTIDSIRIKDIKEKLSNNKNVEIKDSKVNTTIYKNIVEKGVER